MTDFRERVFRARDESTLKRLASRIPGYGGYLEKEMRRDADKLLREEIAAQLEQQHRRLTEYQQELLSEGGLSLMDDVDRVQKRLMLLSDRLRTAVYGYAGWFDAVTIREDALDALYEYDATLLADVDGVAAGVEEIGRAVRGGEGVKEALSSLRGVLNALHEKVDERRDVLIGAAPLPETPAPVEEAAAAVVAPEEAPPAVTPIVEEAPPAVTPIVEEEGPTEPLAEA